MNRQSVLRRTGLPVLLVFIVAAVSMTGYFNVRGMEGGAWQSTLTWLLGAVYFIAVAFGTLFVYTSAAVGGAGMRERILGSAIVPFVWMTKEVLRLTESHPFIECLYWYLNPLNVWLVTLMILEMGIATLVARRIRRGRVAAGPVVTRGPLLVILGSLIFVVSVYAWGRGENIYVIFLSGYRLFFGSGL